jgi:hypothetical protein
MSLFISDDGRNCVTETFEQDTCPQCSAPPVDSQSSKKADLAGPGIGDYAELEQILPGNYHPLPLPKKRRKQFFA